MRLLVLGTVAICLVAGQAGAGENAGGSTKTGARAVWVAVPGETRLLRVDNPPDGLIEREPMEAHPGRGMEHVTRSVNRELRDVAHALRGLDQSYAIRGFQGCGASTAGSVYIDWRAKGLRRPENVVVLPPAPIILGLPKAWSHCSRCGADRFEVKDECDCEPSSGSPTPLPPMPTLPPAQN